jgi:hypothetical protein
MNKKEIIMRTLLSVIASVYAITCVAGQTQETAEAKKKRIEQRTCPVVSNGLVFVEGEFLPPPYIVSRIKNAIYINGRFIEASGLWPSEKKESDVLPTLPPKNPDIPLEINEKTTIYDKEFIKYNTEKKKYLFATYGQEKGVDMMVDVYASLPCVQTAERDKDSAWTINVVWKSGETYHICQVPPQRSQDNGTHEQAAKMFDGVCEIYSKGLEFNDYFLFGSAYTTGTQDGYGRILVPIAKALRMEKDEEAFVAVMTNKFPMVTGFSEKAFRSFYKHKDKLPQWEPLLQKRCKGRQ